MPAPAPHIGPVLGRYRILEEVGAGGMGVVYRARDEQLERDVAIKVLPPGTLADEAARARFRKEALALAKLNHPNIAIVHEFSTQENVDFLVTEFIPGTTLEKKVAAGPLPEPEIVKIGVQLAEGLEAAHEQNVLHRDLKPGNLRVMPNGRLKILDFGLAKLLPSADETAGTASLTESQELTGTLPYMPPEQLRGRGADVRSDIWSAGVVLYELATGRRPFEQKISTALADDIIHKSPSAPRNANPSVSAGLEHVILKCMEKEPAGRYQSAADLRADLQRISEGAMPLQAASRPWPLLVAAVVIIAFLAISWWVLSKRRAEQSPAARIHARHSIAVLGFKDLSGKPDQAWLSTALSEMFTSELGAGESLRTVPGENVARLKIEMGLPAADSLAQDTLAKIHKALGSDFVVLGSYLDVGGQLRLDLRLQDAVARETVATVSETGSEAQLLQLVSRTGDELRQKVGVAPVTTAQAAEVKTTQPSNPEATRAYAEGLAKLRTFDALAARDLLQKAVALDDSFALAHSSLAQAWSQLGYDQKAKDEAKRAFDLSNNLSREDRLVIEGRYLAATKNWPKAIEIYRTLYTFFPDNLEYGLRLADAQTHGGKAKDALATVDELRKLPPPASDDPRIDLQEANSAGELSDAAKKQAAAERAEQKAKTAGMFLLAARAHTTLGGALYDLGKPKEALSDFQAALQTYQRFGDLGQVANTYFQMSMAYEDQGDFAGARKMADECLGISRQIGFVNGEALALNEIAIILRHQVDFPAAIKALEKSYALKKEIGDKGGMIAARGNLANIYDEQGDLQAAQQTYEEVLQLSQEIGNQRYVSVTWGNLANISGKRGQISQAIDQFHRALDISTAIGNKFAKLYQLCTFSGVLLAAGDIPGADKNAHDALQIARDAGEVVYLGSALDSLGDISVEKNDLNTAHQQYQQALDIYRKQGDTNAAALVTYALADLAREQGNLNDAERLARESVTELDKEKSETAALAHSILANVLLEQGKVKDAEAEISIARARTAKTANLSVTIPIQIVAARIEAQDGSVPAAIQILKKLSADCKRLQLVSFDFDARLAIGEIQTRSDPKTGRATLQSLVHDADAKGFRLISTKATAALKPAT